MGRVKHYLLKIINKLRYTSTKNHLRMPFYVYTLHTPIGPWDVVMALVISPKICAKLSTKHNVTPEEVEQCFANRNGNIIQDSREEHSSEAPTLWFIAETHYGRKLKIVFIHEHGNNYLRTAFDPSQATINNYLQHGGGKI